MTWRQPVARALWPLVPLSMAIAIAVVVPPRTVTAGAAGSPEAQQAAGELYPLLLNGYLEQVIVPTTEMRWEELEPQLREANPGIGDDVLVELRDELARIHTRHYIEAIRTSAPAALANAFTAAELRALAEFHRTATGQQAANAMPTIVAQASGPVMGRIPELQAQFKEDFEQVLRAHGLR